jgi:hypothetical protein
MLGVSGIEILANLTIHYAEIGYLSHPGGITSFKDIGKVAGLIEGRAFSYLP